MTDYTQISAQITESTRDRLDQYARETGLKKSRIIEDAIQQHLDAMDSLPEEYAFAGRLVLDDESWEWLASEIERPSAPPLGLVELLRPHRDEFRRLLGLED